MMATVNAAPLADDALRVAVCGSSAPLPSADRTKPCVAEQGRTDRERRRRQAPRLLSPAPSPDGALPGVSSLRGVNDARRGDWTIADDGSLYTLPIGSKSVEIGRVRE
jgi:hypothetical protein